MTIPDRIRIAEIRERQDDRRKLAESQDADVGANALYRDIETALEIIHGYVMNGGRFDLWRGKCGHHWMKAESDDCPVCACAPHMDRRQKAAGG